MSTHPKSATRDDARQQVPEHSSLDDLHRPAPELCDSLPRLRGDQTARQQSSARRAQLRGNLLWLGVRVAEQHPQITMAADHCNLWDIQAPLKKSADGFMSKIMEAQLQNTGSSSQPLPCKPERVG
jgi:hypothetical protein